MTDFDQIQETPQECVARHLAARTDQDFRADFDSRRGTNLYRQKYGTEPPVQGPQWAPSDFAAAIGDVLMMRSGIEVSNPHPLATPDPVSVPSLAKLADICMSQIHGIDLSDKLPQERVLRAMGSQSDFGQIVASVADGVAVARQNALLDKVLAVTTAVEVANYHEEGFMIADIDKMPALDYSFELKEAPIVAIAASGETVQVASATCILNVSRQVILSDQWGVVTAGVKSFSTQASAREAQFLFQMIASNPNLSDGAPWLDASNSLVAEVSVDGLSAATQLLRNQSEPGGTPCDADPAALIVSADLEPAARVLAAAQAMENELQVIATVHLPAGTWLLQADPSTFPTIARSTIKGSNGSSLMMERHDGKQMNRIDGVGIKARHVVGFSPVSRTGIVSCSVT